MVMGDVPLRAEGWVVLGEELSDPIEETRRQTAARPVTIRQVAAPELKQRPEVAALDRQRAVHVSFPEIEPRMASQLQIQPPVVHPHGYGGCIPLSSAAPAERRPIAIRHPRRH